MTRQKADKQKAEEYLKKLDIARKANEVNPFETKAEQENRISKAKSDIRFFVEKYLSHYATAKCAAFQIDFAIMVKDNPLFFGFAQWGRGLAKSVWCDIIIPLWLWINGEDVFFCLMSDSKERAQELLSDIQAELEGNLLLIHDFGEQKCEGDWEIGNFKTIDQRFIGMAFGVKKKVRGIRVKQRRPNLWVVDDLETPDTISNPKRMAKQAKIIESDLIPTMTGPHRRLLYANNKFARVMTQTILQERHPKWKVHQINAYNPSTYKPAWPEYYSSEYYKQAEENMGIIAAHSEYNHESILQGAIFSEKLIQYCKIPDLRDFKMIIVHWDIAYTDNEKSDYNAVKAWGLKDRNFYMINCFVKQVKMRHALRWMCDFKKSLPPGTNCIFQYESQFWNGEVQRNIDEVEEEYNLDLNLMKIETPHTNKLMRMMTMHPYYQNSRIFYNEELKSHNDTQVGIMQLCSLEEGSTEHDDSPDADQQALSHLEIYVTRVTRMHDGEKWWKVGKMKHKYEIA